MAKRGRPPKNPEATVAVSKSGGTAARKKTAADVKKTPIKLEDISPRELGRLKKEIKAEMYRDIANFYVKQAEKLEKQLAPKK